MEKRHWYVVLTYVIMQFSTILGVPLFYNLGIQPKEVALAYWLIFSFLSALIIILILMRKDMRPDQLRDDRSSLPVALLWSVFGVFLALFAQGIAGVLENKLFGIEPGSENTEFLVEIAMATPLFIVVTSVIGPILEEVIFRKILFGSLYKRFNFILAAVISSIIFAIVHMDFTHILIYTAMGFTFAYLYVKTKRIIVPIIAHVSMNTFVVLVQLVFKDEIEKYQQQVESMQFIFF
ncbi:CPBP family intramembrane glutamic endopeptidase [Bacillus suaedaesalsae]|uniref:CPBP family intramembrane metalloprotease n=1 Tax=Bacillus suaedaesalsae TaxID=2810349 RepID=A0ABS2DJG2_9BACI|nr:type II CAAX endopeptidase family protein [Bacillus suaedaesalsae]MBM6618632.1 CPBP family intramembrane metalloprotease [Bacillus suaedaesalsae]